MRRLLVVAAMLAAVMATPGTAAAIVNGSPDGGAHPEVGALLAPQAFPDGTWEECSGTLISPTVFLTAAHCNMGLSHVAVTFDSDYDAATGSTYWGTFHANPLYGHDRSDSHDIAVVVLDESVAGITPARLPGLGQLDSLRAGDGITSVGYGAQLVTMGRGGPHFSYADVRYVATGSVRATTPAWIRASMNEATGDGGTCYGDSGGPNFLGAGATETNIVAGLTVTGDATCRATNVDYRLDTPSARTFLGSYVDLP
jgi:secreted trypsin-like serine protease